MACLEVEYGAEPPDEGLEEEADYGEDEREDDAESEDSLLASGGDESNSGATCAAVSDSAPAPPNCSEAAATDPDELPRLEVEPAADGFHSGGSSSSTAAAPDAAENCAASEDAPLSVVAERLRETARPLAPGMQRPEPSDTAAPPSPPWQPPWKLGQAPWQNRSEPSRAGRPKMASYPAARGPWHFKQPLHMPPHVPKNGVPHRPPFAYAPKMTARPPPPCQSRSGPYMRENWRDFPAASPSSSPEKVPHKAAPKSMKMRLAKAKSGQAAPKSPAPAAAPVLPAPPSPTWREVLGVAPPGAPTQSRSRSRSPRVNKSSAGQPTCEHHYEVSLSSEEEEENDHRIGESTAHQRETASHHSGASPPSAHDIEEVDAGNGGNDGLVEDSQADLAQEMQVVADDVAEGGMAAYFAEAYREVVAADAAEGGATEDFEVAEVDAAEVHEMEEDECAEIDLAQVQAEVAAYEAQTGAAQDDIEASEAVEAAGVTPGAEAAEAAETTDAADAAAAAEAGALDLDMVYPPEWLVAEGALELVPELQEDGEDGGGVCQELAEVFGEQVEMPGVFNEPVVEAAAEVQEEEVNASQLEQVDGHDVEEIVEIEDEEEEEEEEEEDIEEEGDDEQVEVPEEQEEDQALVDHDDDRMDVEAEALLRAAAQRAQRSRVATVVDEDSEEFFVDIAGSDMQSSKVPSDPQAAPAMKPLRPAGAAGGRQVADLQKLPRQAQKVAPWNRPRPPSFRGVSASTARRH